MNSKFCKEGRTNICATFFFDWGGLLTTQTARATHNGVFAIQQKTLWKADKQEWQSHNMWWSYNTATEKNQQLHKHAKHFGWKFREAQFQAKQVFTRLEEFTRDRKQTQKNLQLNQEMCSGTQRCKI